MLGWLAENQALHCFVCLYYRRYRERAKPVGRLGGKISIENCLCLN